MKVRFLSILLIGSLVSLVTLSSCEKDDSIESSSAGTNVPTNETTGTFTDSRDGHVYKWVKIGDQVWMAENLAYTGSGIRNITDDTEWPNNTSYDGWCYYDNNINNKSTYGVLYQSKAAKAACPSGWHLPSEQEWINLADFLGGESVAGGKLKEIGTTHWNSPNTGADNSSGFTCLPAGNRGYLQSGAFNGLGDFSVFWSATEQSSTRTHAVATSFDLELLITAPDNNYSGSSVRCIRD